MNDFLKTLGNMLWNLTHRLSFVGIIDIVIVAVILYELLILLRRTRSSALLKGLLLFGLLAVASSLFGLVSLNWLMQAILTNGPLVLVILFQPELRKALEKMGRSRILSKFSKRTWDSEDDEGRIIDEIVQTMADLSRRRVGALIVFEQQTGLQDVIETGTRLDSAISAPILENIFEPNTPLHDGAVVIRGDRIEAGACILPLTEASGVSRELGTRHRAGIGLSESTDAVVLIVSEETGTMSMAKGGQLYRPLDTESLREILREIYKNRHLSFMSSVMAVFKGEEDEA